MLVYNPRQMVLITCQGKHEVIGVEKEKHDVVPCSWHSPVSSHPPMYAIFINKSLMAASIIRESKSFVVNFIPYSMMEKVKAAMGSSGEYTEKVEALGFNSIKCEKLTDSFKLERAIGWIECELIEEKEYGDHVQFVGKVLDSHLERDEKRPFQIDGDYFTTTR